MNQEQMIEIAKTYVTFSKPGIVVDEDNISIFPGKDFANVALYAQYDDEAYTTKYSYFVMLNNDKVSTYEVCIFYDGEVENNDFFRFVDETTTTNVYTVVDGMLNIEETIEKEKRHTNKGDDKVSNFTNITSIEVPDGFNLLSKDIRKIQPVKVKTK